MVTQISLEDPNGKKFKYKKLNEMLCEISLDSCESQKEKLKTVFENWKGNFGASR
jgi:hypothetical protein